MDNPKLIEKLKKSYDEATEGMSEEEKKKRNRQKLATTDTKEKMHQSISDKVSKETGSPEAGAAVATGMSLVEKLTPKSITDIATTFTPGGMTGKQAAKLFDKYQDARKMKKAKDVMEAGSDEIYKLQKQFEEIKEKVKKAGFSTDGQSNEKIIELYQKYVAGK